MRSLLRAAFLTALLGVPTVLVHAQSRFGAVDVAVRAGIARGVYPGAVVVVGRADTVLYARGYGHFTWSARSPVPDPETALWDLASLSKVLGTASALAVLAADRRVDLDASVQSYLPEFAGTGKERVTVRMLLDHTSGLPAYAQLYRSASSAEAISRLFEIPLQRTVGTSPIYSDLNAMLAGLVIERVSGQGLDKFAEATVFIPLGMRATRYRPAAIDKVRVVPTALVRGQSVSGEVNDQNARRLDGVAGHAGLFSTGLDVARFAQSWLRITPLSAPWADAATLLQFFQRTPQSGSRALGWDTPEISPTGSPSAFGRCASASTFGHTGWTGTALWIDRQADLFVVFLTNRSYAPHTRGSSFTQLRLVRADVSDAVRHALSACASPLSAAD